ncbi:retrovirus-related pol polyprotein from transposon TNT 1-94 [Tanacetum coccineum]
MPRTSSDQLADNLHDVMMETLPSLVKEKVTEQVKKEVPVQVRDQVPVYLAEGLILERKTTKEETERLISKAILQERGRMQAHISSQIQNAIDNAIPSLVDASVRSYMSGHILHVHPAQVQSSSVPEQQHQLCEHLATAEIDKLVDDSENVVDDSSPPRNDDTTIPGTRLEHRSDKESPKVEITKEKEVEISNEMEVEFVVKTVELTSDKASPEVDITKENEEDITNIVPPVNVDDEEDEITDEVYELKRMEKGKDVEESRNSPIPTPTRSPRNFSNLVSSDTEKLQELMVTHTTPSSSSPHTKLIKTNRLLSLLKTKPTRFKRYKSFFHELQERYGYLFAHLRERFMPRKSSDQLADDLHDVMAETLPSMVKDHVTEQVKKQVQDQVSVYVAKGLILERQKINEEMQRMVDKAILQELDASVRSYMFGHILHVHSAQSQTASVPEQQYQLYLAMKADPQMQQQDIAIWLALQMKFERTQVPQTACRPYAVRPRDQEDSHHDAHPEGENINEEEPGLSTSGNQEHDDDFDFWTDSYASDDDEIPTKQVSQHIMEEISLTIDEAKLKKMANEMLRQRCTSGDEHQYHIDQMKNFLQSDIVWESRKEILDSPHPRKATPLVLSCQRNPDAPALSLINQDLLYLKKGNSGPEKIVLSLHKFPAVIFNDDDIEERTSRWVNKCVKKFNPYARYGVEHWKNPHAKIFYIRKQKEPGRPKEEIYSNSKIVQVIKTYWELGHEHKFITEIVARRANDCIVSITEPDYKNLNKNDIEDIYLLIMNGKVPDYADTGLLWSLSVFIRSSVIWERVHDFQLGIESYQQKVNLTAPTMTFPGIEEYEVFSIVYEPVHGIIYKNSKKEKRVMRHSEIHKFCDATLMRVLEGLKSYNNDVNITTTTTATILNPTERVWEVEYRQIILLQFGKLEGSDATINDLLLKLIDHLGSLEVNGSNGGAFGVTGNGGSNDTGTSKPLVAYHTSPSPFMYPVAQEMLIPICIQVPVSTTGPTSLPGQATTLPHAFNAVTIQDPANGAWNMDIDFMTHRVLLRCDSTVDLYPVTQPSPIPHAFLPTRRLNLHVLLVSPLPNSFRDAFHDSNWQNVMHDEYNALIKNQTWTLVPRPPDTNIVRWMWLFRHKYLADGTLSRYKARLVANGSTQLVGVDVDETFSPVVKPGTIRTTICMHQPQGFRDSIYLDYVCLLLWSLYGLKQAPRAWFQSFASYITRVGFQHSRCDSSLFIYRHGMDTAYLLLYGDDIVLTTSSQSLLQQIITSLHKEFAMTDLGYLNYFLGIFVTRDSSGIFLSQKKYAVEILYRAHMVNCNPSRTPVATESKLGIDGDPVFDPTLYRSLAGSLHYLTFTRLDISYAVQQVCLYMHDSREPYFSALKRILRYVRGTLDYGLQLFSLSTTDLVAYSDADWAGCPTTRRSTSGYCVFFGNNLLSWSSKRQPTLSRSSVETKYRGVANVVV